MREEWVEIGGKLVRMLVPSGTPIEPDEPEVTAPAVDDFGMKIRALASQLVGDGVPSPDLMAALPPHLVRWLSVCDDMMLRSIAKSSDDEIKDHVKGRKYLRGVVCSDEASVDAWVAEQTGRDIDDPELQKEMTWLPA